MAKLLYKLGLSSASKPWAVLVSWLALLGLAIAAFFSFSGTLTSSVTIPDTPTAQVTDRLAKEFPDASKGMGGVVFTTDDDAEFTEAQRSDITALLADVGELDGVEEIIDPFETEQQLAEQSKKLEDGAAQLEAGQTEAEDAQDQLAAAKEQLDSAMEDLDAGQEQLDAGKEQAQASGMPQEMVDQQFAPQQDELDAAREEVESGYKELEAQQKQLEDGANQAETQGKQLDLGQRMFALASDFKTVSADGSSAEATVVFTEADLDIPQEVRDEVTATLNKADIDGVNVHPTMAISQGIPQILGLAEVVGLLVAVVVLVIMLGTLITSGLPILNALIGVGVAIPAALAFSSIIEMTSVTPVLGIMLGLAVGIDYALFIVHRHRTQLKQGMEVRHSIGLANGTSGNAVVFAGSTVVVALLALNLTGIPFLGLMGTVAAVTVIIAVLIAITLTPAMLSWIGYRALSKKERRTLESARAESADGALIENHRKPVKKMGTGRAVLTALATIIGLAVIAIPALSLRLGLPDASQEPVDSDAHQAYNVIAEDFGEGRNGPLVVTADLPADLDDTQVLETEVKFGEELQNLDSVAAVVPTGENSDKSIALFQVIPEKGPNDLSTEKLVTDIRTLDPATDVENISVAGLTSGFIDVSDALAEALPIYLAVVVGLSLIIMVVVFRSLLVPLVATGGFVLSYFAALGAVVAIYQWGWLGDFFQVASPGPVLSFLPTILAGILFGLAMDYQLFISTGMREAYAHGTEARLAVAKGFRAGRSVVTAAAIIMISVFGGFVFADDAMIRSIGFGLAFGVLVDAFFVRLLLVPALMHMLGASAWWLPGWLDKILPDVDVEGAQLVDALEHSEVAVADHEIDNDAAAGQKEPVVAGKHSAVEPVDSEVGSIGISDTAQRTDAGGAATVDEAAEPTEAEQDDEEWKGFPKGSVYDRYQSENPREDN